MYMYMYMVMHSTLHVHGNHFKQSNPSTCTLRGWYMYMVNISTLVLLYVCIESSCVHACPIEICMVMCLSILTTTLASLSLSPCLCPQEICHTGHVSWWRCVLLTGGTGTEWKATHTFHYPTHLVLYTYCVSLALTYM